METYSICFYSVLGSDVIVTSASWPEWCATPKFVDLHLTGYCGVVQQLILDISDHQVFVYVVLSSTTSVS